ncbi:MAG: hypothetical protein IT444_10350 [Phycisphaeraceae bacterium]|nr:hypothetical protein [Phycisphaeraceae bacterium]
MSSISTSLKPRTTAHRINRLIARLRHRQLMSALRGRLPDSFRYAKSVARIRRVVSGVMV